MSELNEGQRAAVEFAGQDILVLAGAGTGKTSTIIERAAFLVRSGTPPDRILILTFTRRAAREIKARLAALSGEESGTVVTGTFHNFCLSQIKKFPRLFGLEGVAVIDAADQDHLMRIVRAEVCGKNAKLPKASELVSLHSYARNTNQTPSDYLHLFTDMDATELALAIRVFDVYNQRKRANDYIDYDDILYVFAKGVGESPAIRDRMKALFDYILVDEMQDTNPLQWVILDGIRNPAKLFCVGDDAQSIYAFRGADFKNVHSFRERVPGSTVLKLEDNYRSYQEILDISNWLLAQSSLDYDKHLHAVRGSSGSKVRILDFDTEYDEAEFIVSDICSKRKLKADWRDHMILVRTVSSGRAFEAALLESDIPYKFIGGIGLLQSAHVKDLLALLRCAMSHKDELAWTRFLPLWPGVGEGTAAKSFAAMASALDYESALSILESKPKTAAAAETAAAVAKTLANPEAAVIHAASQLSTILEERYDNWSSRHKDFDLLSSMAGRHKTLEGFIETYTLDPISTTEAAMTAGDDCVILITAHSAKGTEAPVCYIAKTNPGLWPHYRSLGSSDGIEEERRVLYVAMTRAKDELIITRSSSMGSHAPWVDPNDSTYFLSKLPLDIVDHEDRQSSFAWQPFANENPIHSSRH